MAEILNGGKLTALEPGFVERVGRKLRNTLDVWFGPDLPMSPSAPAGTPPRTLDYPVGYNINIQPRNMEPISFEQMRSLADSFDLVRLCTPMKFGTLQDVTLDISGDVKQLYGQKQFPEAVARGKCKITGKSKFAAINGKMLNDLFFGQTMGAGMIKTSLDESATIPATPFQVTVTNAATFKQDWGVRYSATGIPLTRVASGPVLGQYSVNTSTGVYTFAAADTGASVLISYTFVAAATGSQLNITNQLMGFAPTIQVLLETVYNTNQFSVMLYSVVASKLSFATKQEDFIIPEFDFEAFANAAGQVIDMYSNE